MHVTETLQYTFTSSSLEISPSQTFILLSRSDPHRSAALSQLNSSGLGPSFAIRISWSSVAVSILFLSVILILFTEEKQRFSSTNWYVMWPSTDSSGSFEGSSIEAVTYFS